jgi:hypothetical protein
MRDAAAKAQAFWVYGEAFERSYAVQRRSKIAAHELISVALEVYQRPYYDNLNTHPYRHCTKRSRLKRRGTCGNGLKYIYPPARRLAEHGGNRDWRYEPALPCPQDTRS